MTLIYGVSEGRKYLRILSAMTLLFAAIMAGSSTVAKAQDIPKPKMTRTERSDLREMEQPTTFFLKNATQPNDGNELLTGLRLLLDPGIKLYLVPSQQAIVIKALPDEIATAAKFLNALDKPRSVFRINFTLNEMDGGKHVGTQHASITATNDMRVTLKQGSKVPVSTGKFDVTNDISETQTTYLDVGQNFDVTVDGRADSCELKYKVEQSGVMEDKPSASSQTPSIRQTVLDGIAMVTLGKPMALGSVDMSGTARHLDIEVMVEKLP